MLSLFVAAASADPTWPGATYKLVNPSSRNSPITMDVSSFQKGSKPGGSTKNMWHKATNMASRGAKSWTNVKMVGENGREHTGIAYTKDEFHGNMRLKPTSQVAIYMPENAMRDLERGDSKITLVPVGVGDEPLEPDLERALLPPFYPLMPFAPWGAYMAAGFATLPFVAGAAATAAAAMMPAEDLERDEEHALALHKKHAKPLRMVVDGKAVSFRNAADLERKMFLPFLAAPLMFYPWGFALGAAYYTLPAAVFAATTAPLVIPFFNGADHTALYKDMGATAIEWYKNYFTTYWASWMYGYMYWSWILWTVYWQPAIANWWFGVYKAYYEYWTKAMGAGGVLPGAVNKGAGVAAGLVPQPTPAAVSLIANETVPKPVPALANKP